MYAVKLFKKRSWTIAENGAASNIGVLLLGLRIEKDQ